MAPSNPLRSAVFRLALLAVVLIGLAAAALVTMIRGDANRAMTSATEAQIVTDLASLRAEYQAGGVPGLVDAVAARSRHTVGGVYFLGDADGRHRAGNLPAPPKEVQGSPTSGVFAYRTAATIGTATPLAAGRIVTLEGGHVLVVGRDIENQRALLAGINRNLVLGLGGLALLGLGGGYLLARHILGRIGGMSTASARIMAGNLGERLPLAGSGDELDRLAGQLNAMLGRIEQLMAGLREVSDNIAHDLKTPLNRLRNSAEAALATPGGADAWRSGLENTIEQADDLIKTFNALLLIAKLEAGAIDESLDDTDLAAIAHDVAELYEPVAEEQGVDFKLRAATTAPIRANRQLIGQAIANMLENALKYGRADGNCARVPTVTVDVATDGTHALISVADNGPGINAADRARALQRFVRLDQSRTQPGTGLGLSLVAAVAQLHRGEVRLEDNAPGLRIVLKLPLAGREPATAVLEAARM